MFLNRPLSFSTFILIFFLTAFFWAACGQNANTSSETDSPDGADPAGLKELYAADGNVMTDEKLQSLIDVKATGEKKKELLETIKSMEKKILATGNITEQSQDQARNLVNRYHEYATLFPDDEISPEYLFRAADVLRGMGSYIRAVTTLNRLEKSFPGHRHVPEAVFLQGFIYDAFLERPDLAQQHLESFIERFPGHELEASARNLLAALDSSPEELIQRFRTDGAKRNPEL